MTTDTTALQERIARALYENAEYYGPEPTQPPWDWRDDEERGEWMEIAAAVLQTIETEVQAASEKAWGEGVAAWRDYESGLDPRLGHPRRDTPLNPYCTTETGDRA